MPLNATLRAAGLKLDVDTANREVMRWLNEVANTRIHATTGVQPCVRLPEDQAQSMTLPIRATPEDLVRENKSIHACPGVHALYTY